MSAPVLNPAGTARLAVERPGGLDAFLAAVAPGLAAFDLGSDRLALVRELVLLLAAKDGGGRLTPAQQCDLALLIALVYLAGDEGSTRVPLADEAWLGRRLAGILGVETTDDPAVTGAAERLRALAVDPALAHAVSDDENAYVPLIRQGAHLYAQRMLALERALSANFAALLARPSPAWAADAAMASAALDAVAASGPFALKPMQAQALRTAVTLPVALISGGPGTGKTTIVVSILRTLARLGVPMQAVALAAPTGKAAYRMGESVAANLRGLPRPDEFDRALAEANLEPQTLHRLLGSNGAAFRHNENNRLAARVVIVDEASMIDLQLMDALVKAVGPAASLVLLGDADQLPSVEAGAVFRDLVPAAGAASRLSPFAVRLQENVRVAPGAGGARLQALAAAVNERRAEGLAAHFTRAETSADLAYDGPEWLAVGHPRGYRKRLHGFLRTWHAKWFQDPAYAELTAHVYAFDGGAPGEAERERLTRLFAHLDSARLLCPTRVGLAGTGAVNAHLHGLHAGLGSTAWAAGEPVLMLQNDHERKIYNGDQGVVVRVRLAAGDEPELAAVFQRGPAFSVLALATLGGKIERAFAITVHKSQGSEYESVAVLLPPQPTPFLTKEILYTAFTRCKRSLVLVGGADVLAAGAAVQIERNTGVAERLSAR